MSFFGGFSSEETLFSWEEIVGFFGRKIFLLGRKGSATVFAVDYAIITNYKMYDWAWVTKRARRVVEARDVVGGTAVGLIRQ